MILLIFSRRYVKARNTYRTLLKKLYWKEEIYVGKRKIKDRSGPGDELLFLEFSVNFPQSNSLIIILKASLCKPDIGNR